MAVERAASGKSVTAFIAAFEGSTRKQQQKIIRWGSTTAGAKGKKKESKRRNGMYGRKGGVAIRWVDEVMTTP